MLFAGSDLVVLIDLLESRNDVARDFKGLQVLQRELLGTVLLQTRDLCSPQPDRRLNVLDRAVEAEAVSTFERKKAGLLKVLAANLTQSSVRGRLVDWRKQGCFLGFFRLGIKRFWMLI